jgi:hypothetical protein
MGEEMPVVRKRKEGRLRLGRNGGAGGGTEFGNDSYTEKEKGVTLRGDRADGDDVVGEREAAVRG